MLYFGANKRLDHFILTKKIPIFYQNWDFSPKSSENLEILLRNISKSP